MARPRFVLPGSTENVTQISGRRPKHVGWDPTAESVPPSERSPADPLLEYAEREGKLLARIGELESRLAEQAAEIERLRAKAIHEARTNPPPDVGDD